MAKRIDVLLAGAALTALLAACGGGGGGSGSTPPTTTGGGSTPPPTPPPVTSNTIGVAQPNGTIGTVNDASFGVVGGYTQQTYSQVLAFAPGTTITIKNLSSTEPHTLNVLSTSSFPASPTLSTAASGGSTLAAGYASGSIPANGSVTVTLATAGTYYIGCAYHYMDTPSMRDVLLVSASATPGAQATPQPSGGTPPPSGGTGYGY